MRAAWLALVMAGVAWGQARPAQCVRDAECTLTDFEGCCGGCCRGPRQAIALAELQREQQRCAAVDCARPNCAAVRCRSAPPELDARAVCRAGQCVKETGVARSECRNDSDCTLTYPAVPANAPCHQSRCGCCPTTQPVAVPLESRPHILQDEAPPARPRDLKTPPEETRRTKDPKDPQFGLSVGGTPPPQCSPCPAPQPARAVCRIGRCAVDFNRRVPLPR